MEKIKQGDEQSQSKDLVQDNIEKLKTLFPEIVTEGKIDFKVLQEVLGEELEEGEEYYRFTWAGKAQARREANKPSTGTLRPAKEESVDWDTTQNLYLEGDNLEVLKLLQKSYANKVKMIYIDPPYNTGKDFVYKDNYKDNLRNYQELTGQIDSEGNKMSTNTDSDGRYHSNWLNMMYPRLRLARNLLKDDGVIFMSIDDNEVENLKKIGNEIFGEENFIGQLIWEKKKKGAFLSGKITSVKEYVIIYSKNLKEFNGLIGEINTGIETYPCINAPNKRELRTIPNGLNSKYKKQDFTLEKGNIISASTMDLVLHSDLIIEKGVLKNDLIIEGNWRYSQESMTKYAENGELYITQDLYIRRIVSEPRYKTIKDLLPRLGNEISSNYKSLDLNNLFSDGWGSNEDGNQELLDLLGEQNILDYPKPSKLLAKLIASVRDKDSLILDFFSGSATLGHSTFLNNIIGGGNEKFILVQLPELLSPDKKEQKAGYEFCKKNKLPYNISEIGKERIRRVIKKIKTEKTDLESQLKANQKALEELKKEEAKNPALFAKEKGKDFKKLEKEILTLQEKIQNIENSDLGFKVFKLDTSNIQSWSGNPNNLEQELFDAVDNIKTDRSEEDVLYEILLKYGLDLTLPIEEKEIAGKTVFNVGMGALFICLAKAITKEVAVGIGEWKTELNPAMCRVIFKDSGFKSDADKTNAAQNLKRYGITEIKSI